MGKEVLDVVEDEKAEAFGGFVDAMQSRAEAFQDECKGCTLNEIEEMLFAFEIVVEAGKGNIGGAADVTHGGTLEAVLSKDL
jgi:predicted dinucleotide-utilizing enzyme